MKKELQLALSPEEAYNEALFNKIVAEKSGLSPHQDLIIRATKRSIDARGRKVKINVTVEVYSGQTPEPLISRGKDYHNVFFIQNCQIPSARTNIFTALQNNRLFPELNGS